MGTKLCLQCIKYSHAEGVRNDGTFAWSHLTDDSLSVVLTGVNTATQLDSQLTLQIIQGNQVLEEIDIAQHVDKTIAIQIAARQAQTALLNEHLPIYGISKGSQISMRYFTDKGQQRRVQVSIRTLQDCQRVVNVLVQRGMTFREPARPRTGRPDTGLSIQNAVDYQPAPKYESLMIDNPRHQDLPRHTLSARPLGALEHQISASSSIPSEASFRQSGELPFGFQALQRGDRNAETDAAQRSLDPSTMYRSHTLGPQPLRYQTLVAESLAKAETHRTTGSAWIEGQHPGNPSYLDLPSEDSSGRHNGTDQSNSRPGSALALPPLPKPNLSRDAAAGPASRASNSYRPPIPLPSSSSPSERTTGARKITLAKAAATGAKDLPESSSKTASPNRSCPIAFAAGPKIPRMDDLLYGRKALAERSDNAKLPSVAEPGPQQRNSNESSEAALLHAYTSQDPGMRQAMLDDFMVANLENPAFTTLCEDVENSWRRIALGL